MRSIRARLLAILLGSTGLVWVLAVIWIYLGTQAEVERVLDARLMEAARMVNSLLTDQRIELAAADADGNRPAVSFEFSSPPYERQLSCQIWSLDGTLVGRSEHAPEGRLTEAVDGFSETVVGDETWRVYTIENPILGVRVMVGDSISIRDRLVSDVITGLVVPAALILPFLATAIWLSVRRGMAPLNAMADALSSRPANDLRPLPDSDLPQEIAPAVRALNGLFTRVADARDREKTFTAFAAHELQTPLAGLKTQAQVALASGDGDVHANALRQISTGVDRTSRLVKQLLDLVAVEAEGQARGTVAGRPMDIVERIVVELPPAASGRVEVADGGADLEASLDPILLTLALRNLIENAINHSPDGAKVVVHLCETDGGVDIVVEDTGPGMPENELPRAADRFFRGRASAGAGSGLGLAIAKEAADRMGGALHLENRQPHGLRAVLSLRAKGAP
ncbi:ATP-binding protein [Microbaculum marinisediminis]|uniref:histidine kinase n=1 Tax=Microbaculum marinisediminis TaxID=2931392 RepID=A0AAW5R0S1_9HYPH|nr:ATP-binding protein [Microbaculum sp. A6E488]MCT8973787.1 ATP-binding protein [Microbaculum sp. A6E488]